MDMHQVGCSLPPYMRRLLSMTPLPGTALQLSGNSLPFPRGGSRQSHTLANVGHTLFGKNVPVTSNPLPRKLPAAFILRGFLRKPLFLSPLLRCSGKIN